MLREFVSHQCPYTEHAQINQIEYSMNCEYDRLPSKIQKCDLWRSSARHGTKSNYLDPRPRLLHRCIQICSWTRLAICNLMDQSRMYTWLESNLYACTRRNLNGLGTYTIWLPISTTTHVAHFKRRALSEFNQRTYSATVRGKKSTIALEQA